MNKPSTISVAVAVLVMASFSHTTVCANLLPNGGFESATGPADFQYLIDGDTSIPSWVIDYDGIGEQSYWRREGHQIAPGVGSHVAEGLFSMTLNDGDSMGTTFPTIPGQSYRLSFFGISGFNSLGSLTDPVHFTVGDLDASISLALGTLTSLPTNDLGGLWSSFATTFNAAGPTSVLRLSVPTQGAEWGGWDLDAIVVTEVSAAVPEPTSCILIGLGSLMFLRRGCGTGKQDRSK